LLLALDIGNTDVKAGVFDGPRLRATWRFSTERRRSADEYAVLLLNLLELNRLQPGDVQDAVIASVVPPLTPRFEDLCRRYFKSEPLVVAAGVKTGLRILYDSPRDVGADRIVGAVAATRLYGPPPLIIIELGTTTVFDAVSADGEYLGGAIAPGIESAADVLFERASQLRRIELDFPQSAIGRNTVNAMQSGVMYGYVSLVEGMLRRFQHELGGAARVIASGGWASTFARQIPAIDVVDANLVLTGLRLIYEANQ
jgi:type III pantothenate kinase